MPFKFSTAALLAEITCIKTAIDASASARPVLLVTVCWLLISSLPQSLIAQQEGGLSAEVGLSAIFTSGNTRDQNLKFNIDLELQKNKWLYGLAIDGFRSSTEGELSAQRLYNVVTATYNLTESNFIVTRASYDDDRFSGYDNQSQISANYGQSLFNDRENLDFSYNIGVGLRSSRSEEDDFREAILRAETNFSWDVSATATFTQQLSVDGGNETTIVRSESAIESHILDNLSMKFSINVKFQSEVPIDRKKTDTISAVSLIYQF